MTWSRREICVEVRTLSLLSLIDRVQKSRKSCRLEYRINICNLQQYKCMHLYQWNLLCAVLFIRKSCWNKCQVEFKVGCLISSRMTMIDLFTSGRVGLGFEVPMRMGWPPPTSLIIICIRAVSYEGSTSCLVALAVAHIAIVLSPALYVFLIFDAYWHLLILWFQLYALFWGSRLASSEKRKRIFHKRPIGEAWSSGKVCRGSCLRSTNDYT